MKGKAPLSSELVQEFESSYEQDSQFYEESVVDIPSSPDIDDSSRFDLKSDQVFSSQTASIVDWDDTLCPSTHLASLGLRVDDLSELPQDLRLELEQLEDAALGILKMALRFGAVVIVTNAEAGWVELSGSRFLPRVVKFLQDERIKVVSARTMYEGDYPNSPSNWKAAAFAAEVREMFVEDNDDLNLLVLGDSTSERDAAHALGNHLTSSKIKTVKFVERPSIDQLQRQIELVRTSYFDLCEYSSSFDVNLTLSTSTSSSDAASDTSSDSSSDSSSL